MHRLVMSCHLMLLGPHYTQNEVRWIITVWWLNYGYVAVGYDDYGNFNVLLQVVFHMLEPNIERHTAHTSVSWPNPKQLQMVHTSYLMMIIRYSAQIPTTIMREISKFNTHSSIYCMKDNWDNRFNLRHTLDRMFLTGILEFQYLRLQNNDNDVWWYGVGYVFQWTLVKDACTRKINTLLWNQ